MDFDHNTLMKMAKKRALSDALEEMNIRLSDEPAEHFIHLQEDEWSGSASCGCTLDHEAGTGCFTMCKLHEAAPLLAAAAIRVLLDWEHNLTEAVHSCRTALEYAGALPCLESIPTSVPGAECAASPKSALQDEQQEPQANEVPASGSNSTEN